MGKSRSILRTETAAEARARRQAEDQARIARARAQRSEREARAARRRLRKNPEFKEAAARRHDDNMKAHAERRATIEKRLKQRVVPRLRVLRERTCYEINRDIDFQILGNKADPQTIINQLILQIQAYSRGPGDLVRISLETEGDVQQWVSTKLVSLQGLEDSVHGLFDRYAGTVTGISRASINIRPVPAGGSSLIVPEYLKKRGLTLIRNEDNSCGLRCLVLGLSNPDKRKNLMKKSRASQLEREAQALAKEIGHDYHQPMQITDFDKFVDKCPEYQVVFLHRSSHVEFMYETEARVDNPTLIHIFWDRQQNHYHSINDVNMFTNDRCHNHRWCFQCKKSIDIRWFPTHKCKHQCKCCRMTFPSKEKLEEHFEPQKWRDCPDCNQPLVSDECQAHHKCDGKSWKCKRCSRPGKPVFVPKERWHEHKCGEMKCQACGEYYTGDDHRCFIQKLENKEVTEDGTYPLDEQRNYLSKGPIYVYDFESELLPDGIHEVDTVVVRRCYSDERLVYHSLPDFMRWAMAQKNCTFIAHNARGYDGWMIWQYLINNTAQRPSHLVLAGNKVMYMKHKSNRYLDSLNHIASSLEKLPTIFGLDKTNTKKVISPICSIPRRIKGIRALSQMPGSMTPAG